MSRAASLRAPRRPRGCAPGSPGHGPEPPVVVLYGPAGAGKTTLVAAVAHELAAGVADRGSVLWLNLGDVSDPSDGLMRAIRVIERHDGRPPSRLETLDPDEEWEEYLS